MRSNCRLDTLSTAQLPSAGCPMPHCASRSRSTASLGACWVPRSGRVAPGAASRSASACASLPGSSTSAGWLHTLRMYCSACGADTAAPIGG